MHTHKARKEFFKNKTVLILDVDGTLLDTLDFIESTYLLTFQNYNVRITKKQLKEVITLPARDIFSLLAPHIEGAILHNHLSATQLAILNTVKEIEGTTDVLKQFKKNGGLIATVTSRTKDTGIELLMQTKLYDLIDYKLFRDDITHAKPHPESLNMALKYFGSEKSEAVMIGDSVVDIMAGKNANVSTVGVLTGFDKKLLKTSEPDLILKSISHIAKYI